MLYEQTLFVLYKFEICENLLLVYFSINLSVFLIVFKLLFYILGIICHFF